MHTDLVHTCQHKLHVHLMFVLDLTESGVDPVR